MRCLLRVSEVTAIWGCLEDRYPDSPLLGRSPEPAGLPIPALSIRSRKRLENFYDDMATRLIGERFVAATISQRQISLAS